MKSGFTLIEIIVAIFILTVGIYGILSMFPFSMKIIRSSEMNASALYLVQQKMESEVSSSYQSLAVGTGIENSLPSPFSAYTRETKISYVDPTNNMIETQNDMGIKKIEVKVSWNSFLGISRESVNISTLIANR